MSETNVQSTAAGPGETDAAAADVAAAETVDVADETAAETFGSDLDQAGPAGDVAVGEADDADDADDDEEDDDEAGEADEADEADGADGVRSGSDLLVQEGDIAADYLERLLDIVDFDGDIDLDVENGRAAVAIVGSDLKALVGPRGETLDALQELTRLAVQQQTGVRSRLMLDVGGHRQSRRDELQRLAADAAARVVESGEPSRLSPMNPFERKVVHDAIAGVAGVTSESEGEEPNRRVVVIPQS